MKHICFEVTSLDHHVQLIQTGFDSFTVVYGKQIKNGLNYTSAAKELGQSIMHSAACAGRLDNRSERDAKKDGDSNPYFSA